MSAPFRSDAPLRINGLQEKRATKATLNSLLLTSLRLLPTSAIATFVIRHSRKLAQASGPTNSRRLFGRLDRRPQLLDTVMKSLKLILSIPERWLDWRRMASRRETGALRSNTASYRIIGRGPRHGQVRELPGPSNELRVPEVAFVYVTGRAFLR